MSIKKLGKTLLSSPDPIPVSGRISDNILIYFVM